MYELSEFLKYFACNQVQMKNGIYELMKPLGKRPLKFRIKAAWAVFKDRAVAVRWHG